MVYCYSSYFKQIRRNKNPLRNEGEEAIWVNCGQDPPHWSIVDGWMDRQHVAFSIPLQSLRHVGVYHELIP